MYPFPSSDPGVTACGDSACQGQVGNAQQFAMLPPATIFEACYSRTTLESSTSVGSTISDFDVQQRHRRNIISFLNFSTNDHSSNSKTKLRTHLP